MFEGPPRRKWGKLRLSGTLASLNRLAARIPSHRIRETVALVLTEILAPFRSTEVAEAVLGIALVAGISMVVPGQWGFLGWEPHPLWIVVLAIAIRYAAPAGYIAGLLAAASEIFLYWLLPGARFHAIPERALIEPFLFIVVGILVSRAVQSQRQRVIETDQHITVADQRVQSITAAYQTMRTTKLELEKQIIGQAASINALYRIAKQLETLRVSDLYPAILNLVERFLECQSCALYLIDRDSLRLRVGKPEMVFGRQKTMALDTGLIGQVIHERRVVTVRDRLLQAGSIVLNDETALIAGPLLDGNGDVSGVVVIERLPFLKFTPTTISLFTIILDWASTVLANAAEHERTREQLIEDETTGAYTASHMLRLMREHLQCSGRYQLPVSIVVVQIPNASAIAPAIGIDLPRKLTTIMRQRLRTVDIIGHHADTDKFVLILPMTDRESARTALSRITDDIRAARILPYGNGRILNLLVAIVSSPQITDAPEAVLAEASTLLARRRSVSPTNAETLVAESSISPGRAFSATGTDD